MNRILFPPFPTLRGSAGLLILRVVAGTAMALHGWPKIQNATSWMGPDATIPPALQAAAAVAEFGGGIAWVVGLLTPLASLLIGCTMAVAAGMFHIPAGDPFVASGPGPSYEPALGYLAIALALLLIGPGRFSLDWLLFGRHPSPDGSRNTRT